MFAVSALVIGFLGSFHCIAMCGPIALALTGSNENNLRYIANRTFYNVGRIFTYSILGLLAGLAGHTFLMAGFQKSFSILIGVLMIITVLLLYVKPTVLSSNRFSLKISGFIKKVFQNQINRRNRFSLFITGMANGVLPCGFVYLALAGAAATQIPYEGMIYMAMFGLGTFPAMMLVSVFGKFAGIKLRNIISKASPVLMIILGVFFIYRGIMISPGHSCHQAGTEINFNMGQHTSN